ncbi:hypothetical protein BH10PLA1_BH10PLA1_08190 [soil metagenome]
MLEHAINFAFRSAAKGSRQRREMLLDILSRLNSPGAMELNQEESDYFGAICRSWVEQQISAPRTATFHDQYFRRQPAQAIVAGGQVESDNALGARSSNWYVVSIDLQTGAVDGDLIDFNPVAENAIPPPTTEQESGMLAAIPEQSASGPPRWLWPVLWFVVAILAALFAAQ